MARFGFCGPSYTSQSPIADDSRAVNWYCESIEDPAGKSPIAMYPSPGLALMFSGLDGPVRGAFTFVGRTFIAAGAKLYEIKKGPVIGTPPFTISVLGMISRDTRPVYFAGGPNQVLISAAGVLYVLDLTANTVTPVNATQLAGTVAGRVGYVDGFFVVLFKNSGKFQYSSPDDATTWDAANAAIVSVYPDNVQSFVVNYRELIFFGTKQSQAYYDSGNLFTFDVDPSGFIEQGTCAPDSVQKLDNSVFFLSGNEMGQGIVYRLNGFSPVRISNHAIEFAFSQYPTIADAIGYTFVDQGHSFYHLYFPTANKSWRFDVATGFWHEVDFNGSTSAHRSQCHTFNFGTHIVGDWQTGSVYAMSISNVQDFGNPIVRERRAPHISSEQEYIYHHQLQIDLEVGLGPMPPLLDGTGHPREPQVELSWSDDGGKTWSNPQLLNCGGAGQYLRRAIARRLGRSRDRVYKLRASDPIPYRIIDAYLKATPGFETQERYSKQVLKIA